MINELKVEKVDIESIYEDPENARFHPNENLTQIEKSLKRFGQRKPIAVSEQGNIIIAGNGTFRAAKKLGWKFIWVAWSSLSPEEALAYGIADNQTGLTSEWDVEMLSESLKKLDTWNPYQDWESIGFTENEVVALTGSISEEIDITLDDTSDSDTDNFSDDSDIPDLAEPIRVTGEQREIINYAIQAIREEAEDLSMSEGRCLELLCADYLAGTSTDIN